MLRRLASIDKKPGGVWDAGMVTTRDDVTPERAKMLRAHGMRRRYYHDEVGWTAAGYACRRCFGGEAAAVRLEINAGEAGFLYISGLRRWVVGKTTADGVVLPFTDPRPSMCSTSM